jgi:membrane fusion protein (multidrug efflux system)
VKLHGEVESFSGATGARFSLLPPDNATGNFTKVVQRVPVRIRLHDVPQSVLLRPGMSVELSVDTRK